MVPPKLLSEFPQTRVSDAVLERVRFGYNSGGFFPVVFCQISMAKDLGKMANILPEVVMSAVRLTQFAKTAG